MKSVHQQSCPEQIAGDGVQIAKGDVGDGDLGLFTVVGVTLSLTVLAAILDFTGGLLSTPSLAEVLFHDLAVSSSRSVEIPRSVLTPRIPTHALSRLKPWVMYHTALSAPLATLESNLSRQTGPEGLRPGDENGTSTAPE